MLRAALGRPVSVYSISMLRLYEAIAGGSPYESAAVPANYVWVVRNVVAIGRDGPNDSVVLGIQETSGDIVAIGVFTDPEGSGFTPMGNYNTRIVLNPGEKLYATVLGGTCDMAVSGYQLTNF